MLATCGTGSRLRDAGEFLQADGRLDEGGVGAGLDESVGALNRPVEAVHRPRVGARNDLEIVVVAAVHRGLDLLDHLAERHHVLALEVAALLGEDLILDLDAGGARALERPHGPPHVEGVAEAGVGIGQDRHRDGIADRRHVVCDLAQGHEADVGHAERHVRDAGAGDIDRLVAEILDHPGEQGVRSAGQNRAALLAQQGLQPCGRASVADRGIHAMFLPTRCKKSASPDGDQT